MPYELLDDVPETKTASNGSLLGSIGKVLGGGALKAAGNLESLLNPAQAGIKTFEAIAGPSSLKKQQPSLYETAQKFPQAQALEPQSGYERFGQNVLSQLPLGVASTIGSIPLAVARTAGSELGSSLAEESGAGPIGQLAGGLAGGALTGKAFDTLKKHLSRNAFKTSYDAIKKGIVDPTTLNNLATTAQHESYETEKKLGQVINQQVPSYEKSLDKIYDRIKQNKALTKTDKNDLISKVSLMQNEIQQGKINAAQLVDNKKQINDAWAQAFGKENKTYRMFLDDIRNLLVNTGEDIGKDHPEWLRSWKAGDNITKALNFRPQFMGIIDEYPSISKLITNPITKALLGAGGYYYINPATLAIPPIFEKGKQLAGFAMFPETKHLLANAFKFTVQRNIPQLAKTLKKLNENAEEYSNEAPQGRYELID